MVHILDYVKSPPTYSTYKKRAAEKFENEEMISETEFNSIVLKDCHYCGKIDPNGIDRYDNTIGYSKSNCKPCCKHCNYVKGNLSIDHFNEWTERFVAKQSS